MKRAGSEHQAKFFENFGFFCHLVIKSSNGSLWWIYCSKDIGGDDRIFFFFTHPVSPVLIVVDLRMDVLIDKGWKITRIHTRAHVRLHTSSNFYTHSIICHLSISGGKPWDPDIYCLLTNNVCQLLLGDFPDLLKRSQDTLRGCKCQWREESAIASNRWKIQ